MQNIIKAIHRLFFFLIMMLAIIWGVYALKASPLELFEMTNIVESIKITYILGVTAIFWPIFYVEIVDLAFSAADKNGELYHNYFISTRKDLIVNSTVALVLLSIYWMDGVPYSFSGIDIGIAGAPFLVSAIYDLPQLMKTKLEGTSIRKAPLLVMLIAMLAWSVFSYFMLLRDSAGNFESYQAIWFQITILCGSFYMYSYISLQLHMVRVQEFKISKFKTYFFKDVLKSKNEYYSTLEASMESLNKNSMQARVAGDDDKTKN